jgi:segregation and condensation protein B
MEELEISLEPATPVESQSEPESPAAEAQPELESGETPIDMAVTAGEVQPPVEPEVAAEAESAGATPEDTPSEAQAQPEAALADPEPPLEAEPPQSGPEPAAAVSMEELLGSEAASEDAPEPVSQEDAQIKAVLEAIVYVTEEPLTLAQIAAALGEPTERVRTLLEQVVAEFDKPGHGLTIREVAGGYKMATKPEHHEAVRNFVKSLKPPLKLSLPALETLAVIAYKQPVTAPEIMEIRGVQGTGVLKTLLDRKLIAVAGRKNVIGKPILYKTTKEFLIQFGLKDLAELPSLKEFEEIRRMAFAESEPAAETAQAEPASSEAAAPEPQPQDSEAAPANAVEAPAETGAEPPVEPAAEPPTTSPEPEAIESPVSGSEPVEPVAEATTPPADGDEMPAESQNN